MPTPHSTVAPTLEELPHMKIVDPDRLRLRRKDCHLTLRHLARLIGCSHTQVRLYEIGKTRTMPEERARDMSRCLGFPLEDVFAPEPAYVMPEQSIGVHPVRQAAS